jgi:TRAP-type mannitol/chloroaromatic compound transport system permease small subunit
MFNIIKYYFYSAIVLLSISAVTLAQNTQHDVNIDVDVKGAQWYTQWWIWVIVAGFFMITIIALVTRPRRAS